MMSRKWDWFINLGTYRADPEMHQSIKLANYFALVLFVLTIILISGLVFIAGFTPGIMRVTTALFIYPIIPLLQHYGYHLPARLLASTFIPVFIIVLLLLSSPQSTPLIYSASYFPPRILSMAACTFPMFLFNTYHEKKWIIISLTICGICTLGYDFWLNLIGFKVDLYNQPQQFYYYNLVFTMQFFSLVVSAFIMRKMADRADYDKRQLMNQLQQKNAMLSDALFQKNLRQQELIEQTQQLKNSKEKLTEAYKIIEKQKEELRKHNENLEDLVIKKSQELLQTNEELNKSINELRQFSFTISHNLRGPVARLKGLTSLLNLQPEGMKEDQKKILHLIQQSAQELDDIIKDLNQIIDIRKSIHNIREKLYLYPEANRVLMMLREQIPSDAQIEINFSGAPFIYGIRPMLNSILYNLISNAIKYRSPTRPLRVMLRSETEGDDVIVTVTDNGLGINLDQHGKDLFGLYKRFHTHTDGKGLGLYLVKTQLEMMNGSISVSSKLNQGTVFTLRFTKPSGLEGQIYFENEYGQIYYNARLNMSGIWWKKPVTSEAYRQIFEEALEMAKTYNAPFWLSDIRNRGEVDQQDFQWMASTILPRARQHGLTHIAVVYKSDDFNSDRITDIKSTAYNHGISVKFFTSKKEAEAWLEYLIEMTSIGRAG
jgi:signal transduction histidine kinase